MRSGKSQLLSHIESTYGFEVVSASSVIYDRLCAETGRTRFEREELREAGLRIRRQEGPDFIVSALESIEADRIVVDGLRNLTAFRSFKEVGGKMIGLVARSGVRFARANTATDGKLPPSSVEAMAREEIPELCSLDRDGLHILPILWSIEPLHIIDSSDMTIDEMNMAADRVMDDFGIDRVNL